MTVPSLTQEELLAVLQRSTLNTVLIEGNFDLSIIRKIESRYDITDIDFQVAGNKDMILRLFNQKNNFQNIKVCFWVDKDLWVLSEIPYEYREMITTTGYSIENDLIEDGISLLRNLMNEQEKGIFEQLLNYLSIWFSIQIHDEENRNFDESPFKIFEIHEGILRIKQTYSKNLSEDQCNHNTLDLIRQNPIRNLRGKNLFLALIMILSNTKRSSKFSKENIIDLCLTNSNGNLNSIIEQINQICHK